MRWWLLAGLIACSGPPSSQPTDAAVPGADGALPEADATAVDAAPEPPELCATPSPPHVIWDPGIAGIAGLISVDGERLTVPTVGGWVLFDLSEGLIARGKRQLVATGAGAFLVTDYGATFGTWIGICSTADGAQLGAIEHAPLTQWVGGDVYPKLTTGLAPDSSFVWMGTKYALLIFDSNGALRFVIDGDRFDWVTARTTPDQLWLVRGLHPNGDEPNDEPDDRFTIVDPVTGTVTSSAPFAGVFERWFANGTRFLTRSGPIVRVYDDELQELAQFAIDDRPFSFISGHGDVVAVYSNRSQEAAPRISFYRIGSGDVPVAVYSYPGEWDFNVIPAQHSGVVLADDDILFGDGGTLHVLSPGPATIDELLVEPPAQSLQPHAAIPGGWLLSSSIGLIAVTGDPGSPTIAELGASASVASGSPSGKVALLTREAVVLVDVLTATIDRTIIGAADRAALSADGSRMAILEEDVTGPYEPSVRIYDTASGALVQTVPSQAGAGIVEISLSSSGDTLGLVHGGDTCRSIVDVASLAAMPVGPTCDWAVPTFTLRPMLSAAGRVAVPIPDDDGPGATWIYESGSLSDALVGIPIGWLDGTHLLLRRDADVATVDGDGVVATVTLDRVVDPWIDLLIASPTQLYAVREHQLYDLASGNPQDWPDRQARGSNSYSQLAASADRVVHANSHFQIVAVPLPP
jgi:hypothetical protein